MPNWIKVQDQLPDAKTTPDGALCDNSEWMLAVVEDALGSRWCDVSFYMFDSQKWVHDQTEIAGVAMHARITHWMPLPELPEN